MGSLPLGFMLPKMMSAMALPVSLPPYQAWRMAGVLETQGMLTGVPDWRTRAVFGFVAVIASIRALVPGGRSMCGRSKPSLSQSEFRPAQIMTWVALEARARALVVSASRLSLRAMPMRTPPALNPDAPGLE